VEAPPLSSEEGKERGTSPFLPPQKGGSPYGFLARRGKKGKKGNWRIADIASLITGKRKKRHSIIGEGEGEDGEIAS